MVEVAERPEDLGDPQKTQRLRNVYDALVDPDAMVRWLPPTGMTGRLERFDLRPGGSYRASLISPLGKPGKSNQIRGQGRNYSRDFLIASSTLS